MSQPIELTPKPAPSNAGAITKHAVDNDLALGRAQAAPVREWAEFRDPDDPSTTYRLEISLLLSHYTCTYGNGCPGVSEKAAKHSSGCCDGGAYLDEDEVERVTAHVQNALALYPKIAQRLVPRSGKSRNVDASDKRTWLRKNLKTRTADDACVFSNNPGYEEGAGCALHIYAMREQIDPFLVKPLVCTIYPLTYDVDEDLNDGTRNITVRAQDAHTWNQWGTYWCTEDPAMRNVAAEPMFRTWGSTMIALVGPKMWRIMEHYLSEQYELRKKMSEYAKTQLLPDQSTVVIQPETHLTTPWDSYTNTFFQDQ